MNGCVYGGAPAWMGRLITISFFGMIFTEFFGGLLRYALGNFSALVYLPKMLAIVCSFIILIFGVLNGRISIAGLFLIGIFGIFGIPVAQYYQIGFKQSLFALWVYAPLFFGLAAKNDILLILHSPQASKISFLLLITGVFGVWVTGFWRAPWIGETMDVAGFSIETARDWTSFEKFRPPGFTRVSALAGMLVCLLGIHLFCSTKRPQYKFLVWLVAAVGIALSTSSAPFFSFFLVSLLILLRQGKFYLQAALLFVLFVVSFVPLFVGSGISIESFMSSNEDGLTSMHMRSSGTWPDSMALLSNLTDSSIWGRGLGGGGSAERVLGTLGASKLPYEYLIDLTVTDSNVLYLFIQFGVLGIILYSVMWYSAARIIFFGVNFECILGYMFAGVLISGLVTDVMESTIPLIVIGAGLSAALKSVLIRNDPQQGAFRRSGVALEYRKSARVSTCR